MSTTESGLRLVAPNAAAAIEAVRALSEGRAEKRLLLTVPFVEFRAPVARAACAWEDLTPVRMANTVLKGSRERTRQQIEAFKATKPGKFTSRDLAVFSDLAPTVATTRLYSMSRTGEVRRCGKAGRQVIWRFA